MYLSKSNKRKKNILQYEKKEKTCLSLMRDLRTKVKKGIYNELDITIAEVMKYQI